MIRLDLLCSWCCWLVASNEWLNALSFADCRQTVCFIWARYSGFSVLDGHWTTRQTEGALWSYPTSLSRCHLCLYPFVVVCRKTGNENVCLSVDAIYLLCCSFVRRLARLLCFYDSLLSFSHELVWLVWLFSYIYSLINGRWHIDSNGRRPWVEGQRRLNELSSAVSFELLTFFSFPHNPRPVSSEYTQCGFQFT